MQTVVPFLRSTLLRAGLGLPHAAHAAEPVEVVEVAPRRHRRPSTPARPETLRSPARRSIPTRSRPGRGRRGGHEGGAAHADRTPDEFLARLCALAPSPNSHTMRYLGVLENRHHLHARIVPLSAGPALGQQFALGLAGAVEDSIDAAAESSLRPRRLGWANLPARVAAASVTVGRKCGGPCSGSRFPAAKCPGTPDSNRPGNSLRYSTRPGNSRLERSIAPGRPDDGAPPTSRTSE